MKRKMIENARIVLCAGCAALLAGVASAARLESARPAEPSDSYEGDTVVCHATLTETNPPEGHTPCTASATVEHADYGDNEVQARYAESIGVDSLYRVCDDWANPGCQSKIIRGPMKDCSK